MGDPISALINDRFKVKIERLTGRQMTIKKIGRPVDWRKKNAKKLFKFTLTPFIFDYLLIMHTPTQDLTTLILIFHYENYL